MKLQKNSATANKNFLLCNYERYMHTESVASRPFLLFLDPSSLCQLKCPMCPTGLENAGLVRHGRKFYREKRCFLEKDIFDSVVDELGESLFFVNLYNWGEPLLNNNVFYFIKQLKKYNICVELNTNLSFRKDMNFFSRLIDAGVDRIEASIDGFSQEAYGQYRVAGDFRLAKSNLLTLAKIRDKNNVDVDIVWNYLVFKFNEHEILHAKQFCADHGIEFVVRDAALSENLRSDFLPSYRSGECLDGFFEQRAQPFTPTLVTGRPALSCAWHYFYSIVNADGSVSPCCAPWESDFDFGSIKLGSSSFLSIWNGDMFRAARSDVAGHKLLNHLESTQQLEQISTVDDFVRTGTICEGCFMPAPMLDLYSSRADMIVDHFLRNQQFGSQGLLVDAFKSVRSDAFKFMKIFEILLSQ